MRLGTCERIDSVDLGCSPKSYNIIRRSFPLNCLFKAVEVETQILPSLLSSLRPSFGGGWWVVVVVVLSAFIVVTAAVSGKGAAVELQLIVCFFYAFSFIFIVTVLLLLLWSLLLFQVNVKI